MRRATRIGGVRMRLPLNISNQGWLLNPAGVLMTGKKVWFITGAGRGMGLDFTKAALAAGHAVVATGRDPNAVAKAVGASSDLLVVKLDITRSEEAGAAVKAAVDRFGRI